MKIKALLSLALISAILAAKAGASQIQVAYSSYVQTQVGENGDSFLKAWADQSVLAYNAASGAPGAPLPAIPALTLKVDPNGSSNPGFDFGEGIFSKTLSLIGNTYIIMSWGGSQLTVGNGTADILYYITSSGNYTFTNGSPTIATGGLSSIHVYGGGNNSTTVPDGGASVLMLGTALTLLAVIRRKIA